MPRTRAIGSRNSGQAPLPNNSSSILDAPPNPPIIPLASAITGDIVPPSPNATTRPVHEGSSSPYFLNSSDNPGLTLVTPLLSDKNFQSWRRDFELSVGARNKVVFLKGTLPQPPIDHPLHHHWFRCNQMVMSWILHSVSPDIKSSIMFLDTAAEMWQELNSRYDQGNGPRIFELRESLITLHQGDDSIPSLVASTQGSFTNPAIAQNPSASAADANQNHNKRMRPYCTNCHKPGHLKEKCFFLIGFPPGYGDKKKETHAVANQASTSTDPISFLANLTKPKDI
uniref:CCHC-type domain-containing protein n=1 Tax=Cannabis sativa TaxID=3483 RepID=A0A803PIP4_CANSA